MKHTLAAVALAMLAAPAAFAHATLDVKEIALNSWQRVAVRVPHGCDGESTLRVRVAIPEGVIGVKPMPKPGWTLTTVKGPITPYQSHGKTISEGVKEIMWEGELADEHFDEFVFQAKFSDALAEGMLPVPVVQECATGFQRWIDVPAEGQDAHSLPFPAPRVKIVPAAHKH